MDHVNDRNRDEAAKHRFESFKMGAPTAFNGQSNVRITPPLALSISTSFQKATTDMSFLPNPAKKRPNSHHRRLSSVSTRHESAEMMGVPLPDIPVSSSEDNINFGEKDSIRRRALMALEGKPDFTLRKVEIPELMTPDTDDLVFDLSTRPSYPPGGAVNLGLNAILAKRDSYKHLSSSSSSKEQLHTLVEEEEEEDDSNNKENIASEVSKPAEVVSPASMSPKSMVKSRPYLSLRPLALSPEHSIISNHGLPTPVQSPSPLRSYASVTLAPSANRPLTIPPSPDPVHITSSPESSSPADERKITRRSSISYKVSSTPTVLVSAGLPTPDGTPTASEHGCSNSCSSSEMDFIQRRPLSISEQHFLFKSHNALLARIQDLEDALSSRQQNRALPEFQSAYASTPNGEMLQLITDLKAERDELKKDVDGWRQRVNNLEQQVGMLAKRVEAERRDAWVARSRASLLDAEKSTLEKDLVEKSQAGQQTLSRYDALRVEFETMKGVLDEAQRKSSIAEAECARLTVALEDEKKRCETLEKKLELADPLATPIAQGFRRDASAAAALLSQLKTRGLGFTSSVDSQSTCIDLVEEGPLSFGFQLKSVAEEKEELSDQDDPLAGYEDEDDGDLGLQSPGSSSVTSMDDFLRSNVHLESESVADGTVRPSSHVPHRSLSSTWTFPAGSAAVSPKPAHEEIDRFFGCLEDVNASPPLSATSMIHENGKGLFAKSVDDDGEDLPPFVLPSDVGTAVEEATSLKTLETVAEEEEPEEEQEQEQKEDDEVFGSEISGIKITFTPPEEQDDLPEFPTRNQLPVKYHDAFGIEEDEEDELPAFIFGSPKPKRECPTSVRTTPVPSSIPRPVPRSPGSSSDSSPKPPPRGSEPFTNTFNRRVPMPSFIPQPVSSPVKSKPKATPSTTFMRPPPLSPTATRKISSSIMNANAENGASSRSSDVPTPASRDSHLGSCRIPGYETSELQDSPVSISVGSSFMSSPFTGRLSFQPLTNLIPLSWAPIAASREATRAPAVKEPKYVSKEKQLEKLRSRLDPEQTRRGNMVTG